MGVLGGKRINSIFIDYAPLRREEDLDLCAVASKKAGLRRVLYPLLQSCIFIDLCSYEEIC